MKSLVRCLYCFQRSFGNFSTFVRYFSLNRQLVNGPDDRAISDRHLTGSAVSVSGVKLQTSVPAGFCVGIQADDKHKEKTRGKHSCT